MPVSYTHLDVYKRQVHFSVTGSIAAVFTDHFKIISGTGKYIRPDLYAARNCVCTDGTALVNVECTAECTSGCKMCIRDSFGREAKSGDI